MNLMLFGGKMGEAATLAPKGLGSQDLTKRLANRVKLLGQPLSQKIVFENLGPDPPSLIFEGSIVIQTFIDKHNCIVCGGLMLDSHIKPEQLI